MWFDMHCFFNSCLRLSVQTCAALGTTYFFSKSLVLGNFVLSSQFLQGLNHWLKLLTKITLSNCYKPCTMCIQTRHSIVSCTEGLGKGWESHRLISRFFVAACQKPEKDECAVSTGADQMWMGPTLTAAVNMYDNQVWSWCCLFNRDHSPWAITHGGVGCPCQHAYIFSNL